MQENPALYIPYIAVVVASPNGVECAAAYIFGRFQGYPEFGAES